MRNKNNCEFRGNIGRTPEMKFTSNGKVYTEFSIASNNVYTKNGERIEETEWIDCIAWGKQAEFINEKCPSGTGVEVQTRYHLQKWEKDSQKHRRPVFIVKNIDVIVWKKEKTAAAAA